MYWGIVFWNRYVYKKYLYSVYLLRFFDFFLIMVNNCINWCYILEKDYVYKLVLVVDEYVYKIISYVIVWFCFNRISF